MRAAMRKHTECVFLLLAVPNICADIEDVEGNYALTYALRGLPGDHCIPILASAVSMPVLRRARALDVRRGRSRVNHKSWFHNELARRRRWGPGVASNSAVRARQHHRADRSTVVKSLVLASSRGAGAAKLL